MEEDEIEPTKDSVVRTAPRILKVILTKEKAVLLTLTHIVPRNWKYVEVIPVKILDDEITLKIRRIRVYGDEPPKEIERSIQ